MNIRTLAIAGTLAVLATGASAETLISVKSDIGKVLASASNGLTLYTFQKDAENTSNCYGECAVKWPPFEAAASAKAEGDLGIIERKDGTRQWALNGKPLYFWMGDSEKGDVSGHGVGGVWDAVRN